MSGARDEILARAWAAVAPLAGRAPEVPRDYVQATRRGGKVSLFEERLRDYGAGVRRTVAEALDAHGAGRVGVAPGLQLELPGVELVSDDPPLVVEQLEDLDGVITGCALAIAETGTIVLDGGAASGRRVLSLVPDLQICLVAADQVMASVPDAIGSLAERGLHTSPLTFIYGPSATSDIGFERVEGVHGPRRLEVVVVADGEGWIAGTPG